MDDMKRARQLFADGGYTCVLVSGEYSRVSSERGVKPLLLALSEGTVPQGFAAADRVVGRAAAYLYVLLGAKELYADVMSDTALEVLGRYGIEAQYGAKTETIFNRTCTGLCPMESAVLGIDTPTEALAAIKAKLRLLQQGGK